MSRFAIANPHVIVVVCLVLAIVGANSLMRMPVDLFPAINIPVVCRSLADPVRSTDGDHWRAFHVAGHRYQPERDVSDGNRDDGRGRRFEQHPDRPYR